MSGENLTPPGGIDSRQLVQTAFQLARALGLTKVLVQVEELEDLGTVEKLRLAEYVILLARDLDRLLESDEPPPVVVGMPSTPLTRLGQVKMGLFMAALKGHVGLDESALCLAGMAGSGRLDTLLVTEPRREFPWLRQHAVEQMRALAATREFPRLLDIALCFAAQGREGKPLGTAFVLGEVSELAPYLRQLVLNPFEGHAPAKRDIHNPEFLETLREFAAMDGAFVVNTQGIVESAGTYLNAPAEGADLHEGLGARHAAAAAITAVTTAVAVTVSESSGDVSVYHGGHAVLELDRPGRS